MPKVTEPIPLHVGHCGPITSELQRLSPQVTVLSQQPQTSNEPTVSGNGELMVN